MNEIETLTDDDRKLIRWDGYDSSDWTAEAAREKALRIIDAQAKRIAELESTLGVGGAMASDSNDNANIGVPVAVVRDLLARGGQVSADLKPCPFCGGAARVVISPANTSGP